MVEAYELFKVIEARQREPQVILALSNAAGDYNNQTLELRLERQLDGVATPVPNKLVLNKIVEFKLQRPLLATSTTSDGLSPCLNQSGRLEAQPCRSVQCEW